MDTQEAAQAIPAGWYVDPEDGDYLRRWDGAAWVDDWREVRAAVADNPPWYRSKIVWALVAVIVVIGYAASRLDPDQAGAPAAVAPVTVVYKIEGTARTASLTYLDSSGNVQQATDVDVPVRKKLDHSEGVEITARSGDRVSISAQNGGGSGDLTCRIEANGRVINTGHAQGGYSIVTCSARVP